MFRKTSTDIQLNAFSSTSSFLPECNQKYYENPLSWHNQFRTQVTNKIDESIFAPLFCKNNGTPNASIRLLVAMMIIKDATKCSDAKLFDECNFNLLTRSALGLMNITDCIPAVSTYYLFRKKLEIYNEKNNIDLFEIAYKKITRQQILKFEINGKCIRVDSKLIGSNIRWLSRYELIHNTLRLFYKDVKGTNKIEDTAILEALEEIRKSESEKIVYYSTTSEVENRLEKLGVLIYNILPLFSENSSEYYATLKRVFNEQYEIVDNQIKARPKKQISPQSVQSPHDTDCTYREKRGNKVRGYSINITETCADDDKPNLITDPELRSASTPDIAFVKPSIEMTEAVTGQKVEKIHTDGSYHSPDNQSYCQERDIDFCISGIQGTPGRYRFEIEDGITKVFCIPLNKYLEITLVKGKKGNKYRINDFKQNGNVTTYKYRYFTQKEIDTNLVRQKLEERTKEEKNKRNNVEATIFQVGYHYCNNKSRYRGQYRHQMWLYARCLWVNFTRILKYVRKNGLICEIFIKNMILHAIIWQTLTKNNSAALNYCRIIN